MANVCVTGANGYIGRHVCQTLLNAGCNVIAVDFCFDKVPKGVNEATCDIFSDDPDLFEKLGHPDVLIHLAWKDGFAHNSDSHIQNLYAHYRFIRAMMKSGVQNIAVMGTMHEIGYWEGAIDEHTPTNPQTCYGIAKDALRKLCFKLNKEFPACNLMWLRAYYIYGDDSANHSIFTKIMESEMRGKATFPFTTGKNRYDFIEIHELAQQISAAALQNEITGIINVCSGQPISLRDMVEAFIKSKGYHIKPAYGKYPDRPYDSPGVWGSAEKIQMIMKKWKEHGLC